MLWEIKQNKILQISNKISIPIDEIEFNAVRSQGAGGQNINKVSTAVHLRFNIKTSSLPENYQERLLRLNDNRITKDGIIVIKAQQSRSQKKNKDIALSRLKELIKSVLSVPKKRKPTKPTKSSQKSRLDSKTKRGEIKKMRKKLI